MNGFTGLNPELFERQLYDFKMYGQEVCKASGEAFKNFNIDLLQNWCSPKARQFGDDYLVKIAADTNFNMEILYEQIYRSAIEAYNVMARTAGLSAHPIEEHKVFYSGYSDGQAIVSLKEETENGVTGMNVANIKLAIDFFKTSMDKVVDLMNNTPLNIALYDPDGSIQAAYKNEITTRVAALQTDIDKALKALNNAMKTETNTIMIAKDQAEQSLAG